MPTTPDRFPGSREEDEIVLEEQAVDPADEGAIRYVNGSLKGKDSTGVFDLRSGGGISEAEHLALDQLVHELDEDYYENYTYSGSKITNVTVWTDVSMTTKIREYQYTYTGSRITQEVIIQYDGSGVEVERLTLSYSYTGSRISSVTCVRT